MPTHISGMELSRLYYEEAVRPVLAAQFSDLKYAAALLGSGSEVLGFDTDMSTDHDWGPRLQLFISETDHRGHHERIEHALRHSLPLHFHGYSTSFSDPDANDNGTRLQQIVTSGPVSHRVEVLSPAKYFQHYLDFELDREITAEDWLSFPEQLLRSISAGRIFHDAIELQTIRERFSYYPRDVWLFMLASGWHRIGQEEHLMGRAGIVGDELGSSIIALRLVRDIMRLCFLFERQFAPYPKWFGTAFARLKNTQPLLSILKNVQLAPYWKEREGHLSAAYEMLATMQNDLDIMPPLETKVRLFHNRPFNVISADRFTEALKARIQDPTVKRISARLIGGVDQFCDSTDVLSGAGLRMKLKRLYEV